MPRGRPYKNNRKGQMMVGLKARSEMMGLSSQQKKDKIQDKQITNLKKQVKALKYEADIKYKDTAITSTNVIVTGTQVLLNGVALGDDQSADRNGNKIKVTSIQYRLEVITDQDVLEPTVFRMIVYWDKQANGASPTLLGDPLAGGTALLNNATGTAPYFPFQSENVQRFQVVYDKLISLNPQIHLTEAAGSVTDVIPVNRIFSRYHKQNKTVVYGDDTGAIGSINTNSLHVAFISDLAADGPNVTGVFRIYYRDI